MTPDDTARQAADVPAPSLAEIAAAGLACLVPPGAAEEPQFAWLAASVAPAGGAAALQRLLAAPAGGDLPLLTIAYHLQLTPAELLTGGADPEQLFDPYVKQSVGARLFVDAILDDQPIEPDFSVGVRVQRVVDAALQSSVEKRWISLDV